MFSAAERLLVSAVLYTTFAVAQGTFHGVPYNQGDVYVWHTNLVRTRVDPVVYPGTVSPHVHNVIGGNGFGPNMTYESLRASTCNTHQVSADMSAWWSPQLYYKDKETGKLSILAEKSGDGFIAVTNYYNGIGDNDTYGLVDYPRGFRMVAGDPFRTHPPTNQAERLIKSTCSTLLADVFSTPNWMSFPVDLDLCPDRRFDMEVRFPACWDGVNVDSPDHKSHVTYPENGDGGNCPPGFPYRLPQIRQRFTYELSPNMTFYPGCIVSAQGDDTGFGYHVDFYNGWDAPPFVPGSPTQESLLVKSLTDPASVDAIGGMHLPSDSYAVLVGAGCSGPTAGPYLLGTYQGGVRCGYTGLEIDESVGEDGPLDALPGNNPIWSAQDPLQGMAETKFAEFRSAGMPVPDDWEREGCFTGYTPKTSDVLPGKMTPVTCIARCAKSGYSMSGIENGDTCVCGNDLNTSQRYNSTGESLKCTSQCTGAILNTFQFCGGGGVATVYSYKGSGSVTDDTPVTPTGEAFAFSTTMPQVPYVENSATASPEAWSDSGAIWLTYVAAFTNAGSPMLSPTSSSASRGSTEAVTMTGSSTLTATDAVATSIAPSMDVGIAGVTSSVTSVSALGGGLAAIAISIESSASSSSAIMANSSTTSTAFTNSISFNNYAAPLVPDSTSITDASPSTSNAPARTSSTHVHKTRSRKYRTRTKTVYATGIATTAQVI